MPLPENIKNAPILDHAPPTDSELHELLLIGLRYKRIPSAKSKGSKLELGRVANGVFMALEYLGVMSGSYRESLWQRSSFLSIVSASCEKVYYNGVFKKQTQRDRIADVPKDLFIALREGELFAHRFLAETKGYRLYITNAGINRVDREILPRYPALTPELFEIGWTHYSRQVRYSGIGERTTSKQTETET